MAEDGKAQEAPPKKSKMGLIVLVVVAVLLVAGAATAGAVLAPKLMGAQGAPPPTASAEPKEPEVILAIRINPIVVDVRDMDGSTHHLKVSLSGELARDAVKDDVENVLPRGREAAIAYLRSLKYEEVTAPEKFDAIKKELKDRMIEAVGKKRLSSVLVVDFVAQ